MKNTAADWQEVKYMC